MSDNHKNTPGYSASDIEKYRRGELSAREMHELESAALEDPFLADALEGMEIHRSLRETTAADPGFDEDLAALRARLNNRVARTEKKKGALYSRIWTRWAAAVILFTGVASIAYYYNRSAQKEFLVRTVQPHTPVTSDSSVIALDNTPLPPPVASTPAKGTIADNMRDDNEAKTIMRAKRKALQQTLAKDTLAAGEPIFVENEEKRVSANTAAGYANTLGAFRTTPPLAPVRGIGIGSNIKKDTVTYLLANAGLPGNRLFSVNLRHAFGKVLDEHNQPLAGASVYLKGRTDINTVTDQQGRFNLELHEKDSTLKLMVAYIGYQEKSLALNDLDRDNATGGNIIQLQPQRSSLGEVVVVGYGAQRKETITDATLGVGERIDSLWLRAIPITGRQAYLDYLESEKKRFSPLDSTIKGTEIISFDVNKKGELSSFKVEQSLSPAHDSSTIRLVREGPSWKLLRGRQVRAAVQVKY